MKMKTSQFWAFLVIALVVGAAIGFTISNVMKGREQGGIYTPSSIATQSNVAAATCTSAKGICRNACNTSSETIDTTKTCSVTRQRCCMPNARPLFYSPKGRCIEQWSSYCTSYENTGSAESPNEVDGLVKDCMDSHCGGYGWIGWGSAPEGKRY